MGKGQGTSYFIASVVPWKEKALDVGGQSLIDFAYFWGSNNKQRSCDRRGEGAQRSVWCGNELKETGARSARARTLGQNPLVIIYLPRVLCLSYSCRPVIFLSVVVAER